MEYKIFKQKTSDNINYDFIDNLTKQFDISYLSALLLSIKGFSAFGEVETYLNPNISDLYDPFLFKDMKKVMERLKEVIRNREKVVIFSDYDCDGVTSSIILYKVLSFMKVNTKIIIPNRFTNGYGLSDESMEMIIDEEPSLVITTDNGITSVEETEILKDSGIDVIITDHHTPPEVLPEAYAIINPKVEGDNYPFSELCGAGVAFKIACATVKFFELDFDISQILVFAMIGTIADIVYLKSENRTIASLGLDLIRNTNNKGLNALIKKSDLDKNKLNCGNIGFQIGPRINAAGRLDDAKKAVRLFLSEDEKEVDILSHELCEYNDQRKDIEESIFKKSEEYIKKNDLLNTSLILYVYGEDFNEGVMGVAASKICDKYNRPVVIMSDSEDGLIKASCRSITGFDIFKCLDNSRELFSKFGGHSAAAGFSIERENLDRLIEETNEYAKKRKIENLFYKRVYYDTPAIPSNLNVKTSLELEKFAPFGIGNSRSILCLRDVKLTNVRAIGKDGTHLKFSVLYNGNYYDAIGFSMGHYLREYDFTKSFDIVFTMSVNSYKGREKLQFEIKDMDYHDVDLKEYDKAFYNNFIKDLDNEDYFYPEEEKLPYSFETTIEEYKDKVLIIYNRDTFLRLIKYLRFKNYDYKISYNELEKEENKINVLVLPVSEIGEDEVVILDRPEFNDYESEVYKSAKIKYLKTSKPMRSVKITRTFFLYLYRKFKLLKITGNNIYEFINNIRNESDVEINYFTVRLALDIMKEMNILNYSLENDKLSLSFKKVNSKSDIEKTNIMKKLNNR